MPRKPKVPKTFHIETHLPNGEVLEEEITPDGGLVFSSNPALAARVAAIVVYRLARLAVPDDLIDLVTPPHAARERPC